jgi:hypothetical protein
VSTVAQGHAKTGGTSGAALVTLSQGNCTGGSDSLAVSGNGGLVVNSGDIRSNGSANIGGSHATIKTSGNFYDNCTCPVPSGVTAPGTKACGVAPLADPAFSLGPTNYFQTNQPGPGSNVNLSPGLYAANLAGGSSCYFLAPGIYTLSATLNGSNGWISNELRPPDEPNWNGSAVDYKTLTSHPFWPSGCNGSFSLGAVSSLSSLAVGNWGVVVTSTRSETWPPAGGSGSTTYLRESFPSMCHSVSLTLGQALQVTIKNVAGAAGYNVYLAFSAGNPCDNNKWGYATSVSVPNATYSGETTSSMGSESVTIDTSVVGTFAYTPVTITSACDFSSGAAYSIGCAAATGPSGSANPPGDGAATAPQVNGIYAWDPARDIVANGGGDRANYADCMPRGTNAGSPCAGAINTPGAVQLYFKSGACLTSSGNFAVPIFSGYQYNWIALYGDPANNCSPSVSGNGGLRLQGAIYWPAGNWSIAGNGGVPISSEMVVNSLSLSGNGATTISFDPLSTPDQGYSQLSL